MELEVIIIIKKIQTERQMPYVSVIWSLDFSVCACMCVGGMS